MAHCDEIFELLSLRLDDELDGAGKARVERHLARCTDCAHLFEQLRAMDTLFRHAPLKYAPLGFTDRAVAAAFEAELRRSLGIGFLVLMVGTILIGGLALLGNMELLWGGVVLLLTPGFLGSSQLWLGQTLQALLVAGRVSLDVLALLRDLLVGPLLLPSLASVLSMLFVLLFLQRGGAARVNV